MDKVSEASNLVGILQVAIKNGGRVRLPLTSDVSGGEVDVATLLQEALAAFPWYHPTSKILNSILFVNKAAPRVINHSQGGLIEFNVAPLFGVTITEPSELTPLLEFFTIIGESLDRMNEILWKQPDTETNVVLIRQALWVFDYKKMRRNGTEEWRFDIGADAPEELRVLVAPAEAKLNRVIRKNQNTVGRMLDLLRRTLAERSLEGSITLTERHTRPSVESRFDRMIMGYSKDSTHES